tara:strand:- start:392 stop:652 length:261 start_codon:yes stop_codon:yes gene_type:complete
MFNVPLRWDYKQTKKGKKMLNAHKKTTAQYQKNMASAAKTDDLFRKLNTENQWFAFDYIMDHLNEDQKIKIRKYIRDLIKEQKGAK